MSGGRISQTQEWRKSILIAFSADGLVWEDWQVVWSDENLHREVVYPSIMSYGSNNEVVGETFAVVFQYRNVSAPFQFYLVNVTVSVDQASSDSIGRQQEALRVVGIGGIYV